MFLEKVNILAENILVSVHEKDILAKWQLKGKQPLVLRVCNLHTVKIQDLSNETVAEDGEMSVYPALRINYQ